MTQLSTRRVVIVFVLVMCISLTTNVFLLQKIHKQGEPVVTPPTFYQLIDSINENFSYTGYNEILNHSNLFMALPQQANDDTLPKRSKVFVYKGIDKNVVIMFGSGSLPLQAGKYRARNPLIRLRYRHFPRKSRWSKKPPDHMFDHIWNKTQ